MTPHDIWIPGTLPVFLLYINVHMHSINTWLSMPMIFLMYDDQQAHLKMPWDSKPIPPVVQPTNPKWRDREIFPGPWSCQWPICKLLLLHFALQFLLNSISKSFGDIWLLENKPGETSCYSITRVIIVIHSVGNILQDSCWKSRLQKSKQTCRIYLRSEKQPNIIQYPFWKKL